MKPNPVTQAAEATKAFLLGSFERWLSLSLLPLMIVLLGCASREPATPVVDILPATEPPSTARPTAPLVATFTPLPGFPSAATPESGDRGPQEPAGSETATPVSFDELVVDLRYEIPALGLARRLQGDMANRLTIIDEMTGSEVAYRNQGGVLLELRQALPEVELGAVPDDCQRCVTVEYELSLEESAARGWLQEIVLLASIENYLAVALGPHFPPETVVGLRRSASPYAPAHTVALTEDGELWKWLATDSEIPEPSGSITSTTPILQLVDQLADASLNEHYLASCEGSPVETLFLLSQGEARSVSIVCPEFSLPALLLPLYLKLDAEIQPAIADVSLPRPPAAFPLEAVLDYRRADGRRLTIFHDGRVQALDLDAAMYTHTLSTTQLVSITTSLLNSGEMHPGLDTFTIDSTESVTPTSSGSTPTPTSVLVLRGPDGFHDARWSTLR